MFDSITINAAKTALDAYSTRQRITADNIANVNTPNYTAKRVKFEEALAKAVDSGVKGAKITETYSLEPAGLNGNNVNLDAETVSNIDTNLRYQFAAQYMTGKFSGTGVAARTS